jgi:peptide deformylase
MIRDILRYGDPRLLAENAEAVAGSTELSALLSDMIETCHLAPGIGLAAPQIGINQRVAIVDLSIGEDPSALIVVVNPVILDASGEQREEEGCLSVPDLAERVERPARVVVQASDAAGKTREIEGTGLLARALCHEIDHLNGLLYIDRLHGLKRELTWKKIERRAAKGVW